MAEHFTKDPNSIEPVFFVWCDRDGTNSGAATDKGELQGATIATSSTTVASGLTKDSEATGATTIRGVSYGADTVATVWLSGGTAGTDYTVTNRITTSDGRTLDKSITIVCSET